MELLKVLVIEDVHADTRLIRDILTEEPSNRFSLEFASRLQDGLERLSQGGIDAVVLDLSLPDSRGIDTFKRAIAHSPDVPIVVLTGLHDEAAAAEVVQAGGEDYLNKGILDLCTLHRAIRNAVARAKEPRCG